MASVFWLLWCNQNETNFLRIYEDYDMICTCEFFDFLTITCVILRPNSVIICVSALFIEHNKSVNDGVVGFELQTVCCDLPYLL